MRKARLSLGRGCRPFEMGHRAAAERRLKRKLDMRLLPMVFLIFIMNYIDVRILNNHESASN